MPILHYLQTVDGATPTDDQSIFRAIGVEPIINCRSTAIIGGSVELPAVQAAIKEAARRHYCRRISRGWGGVAALTGAEWGMIPSGCLTGLKHVTAACVTGGNPELLIRIPDLTGFAKTQVIIPRYSRNAYDHAVRNIVIEIVMVETPEELAQAINAKTAMIYLVSNIGRSQSLSLENIVAIAKPAGIPF
ncbi:MAG: hypothetical protein R2911_30185 [Caldilineaceae bacterium]